MIDQLLQLIWTLLIIIFVLAAAYVFTRYVLGRVPMGSMRPRTRRINTLEQLPVGRNQKLLLVQMDDEVYFLGVSEDNIVCISRVSEEKVKRWSDEDEILRMTQSRVDFTGALGKVLGRPKKGED